MLTANKPFCIIHSLFVLLIKQMNCKRSFGLIIKKRNCGFTPASKKPVALIYDTPYCCSCLCLCQRYTIFCQSSSYNLGGEIMTVRYVSFQAIFIMIRAENAMHNTTWLCSDPRSDMWSDAVGRYLPTNQHNSKGAQPIARKGDRFV